MAIPSDAERMNQWACDSPLGSQGLVVMRDDLRVTCVLLSPQLFDSWNPLLPLSFSITCLWGPYFPCFSLLPVHCLVVEGRENSGVLNFCIFWVITRRDVVWNRRFGITYRSHLQGSKCPNQEGLLHPWSSDRQVVLKRRYKTTVRRIITQKTEEFSSTAAKVYCLAQWSFVMSNFYSANKLRF
jgi:hypothetical protein